MKFLKRVLLSLISQIIIIMSMNFIFLSYNPENWGALGRASYLVLTIILTSKTYDKVQ